MGSNEKERFPTAYVSGCIVWLGDNGLEEGFICDGIPDMGVFFLFKKGMKLAVDDCYGGWRGIVRSRYLIGLELV